MRDRRVVRSAGDLRASAVNDRLRLAQRQRSDGPATNDLQKRVLAGTFGMKAESVIR